MIRKGEISKERMTRKRAERDREIERKRDKARTRHPRLVVARHVSTRSRAHNDAARSGESHEHCAPVVGRSERIEKDRHSTREREQENVYVCLCVCITHKSCTHHHFIIDLPRGHVFHSHGHVSGLVVAMSVASPTERTIQLQSRR